MRIPYRTRRVLNRVGTVLLALLLVGMVAWLCWVIWLQRYVVYTNGGATLDFSRSANDIYGEEAVKPVAAANISIFYNEGADAININRELTQLSGYYITNEMVKSNYSNVMLQIERLPSDTTVMIEMKGPYGRFFYKTKLGSEAEMVSMSTDISSMERLVERLKSKGFYTVAQISAFRDREYGDRNVPCGLYNLNRIGLWMDPGGMYWLDPTNASVTSWITSVVLELRDMGFDEVLLDNFCFPDTDKYIFNGDKAAALDSAAKSLVSSCASSDFVLSFGVKDPTFQLPDGRTRMYLTDIEGSGVERAASKVTFEDADIRLVFLCESADTRYDEYSVLRSIEIAEEVEARRAG